MINNHGLRGGHEKSNQIVIIMQHSLDAPLSSISTMDLPNKKPQNIYHVSLEVFTGRSRVFIQKMNERIG